MKKLILFLFIASVTCLSGQQWVWAKIADTTETFLPAGGLAFLNTNSSYMAADNMGNFFLATNLRNNTGNVGFSIIKLNGSGNKIWKKYFFGEMTINEMAFSNNNLYAAGTFSTGIIGPDTLISQGKTDVYIACLTSNGAPVWTKTYGGSGYEEIEGLCSDIYSNVYVTGGYGSDTISFGNSTYYSPGNTFLLKSNSSGNIIFSKSSQGGASYGTKVRVDKNGYIYVLAQYGNIRFNTDSLKVWGYNNACLIKFDSTGNYKLLKDIMYHAPQVDMEINSFGKISTTGFDYGNHNTCGITQNINDTAHVLWNQGMYSTCYNGYSDDLQLTGVAMKGSDTYVTGTSETPYCQTFGSISKFMFCRYDNMGSLTLFDTIKYTGTLFSNDIITDSNGDQIVSGIIGGSISFGNNPLQGSNKIYIAKYSENSVVTSVKNTNAEMNVFVYPSPTSGIVSVITNLSRIKISVRDVLGNCVYTMQYIDKGNIDINLYGLQKGVYFIQLNSENEKTVKKIILD